MCRPCTEMVIPSAHPWRSTTSIHSKEYESFGSMRCVGVGILGCRGVLTERRRAGFSTKKIAPDGFGVYVDSRGAAFRRDLIIAIRKGKPLVVRSANRDRLAETRSGPPATRQPAEKWPHAALVP